MRKVKIAYLNDALRRAYIQQSQPPGRLLPAFNAVMHGICKTELLLQFRLQFLPVLKS